MKKLIIGLAAALLSTLSLAVELNTATAADLDTVKGIGPKMATVILEERQKNGKFKDWADFSARVKGVGEKNSVKFSQSGLTVAGKPLTGAPAAVPAAATKAAKPAATAPAVPAAANAPAAAQKAQTPPAPTAAATGTGNKSAQPASK